MVYTGTYPRIRPISAYRCRFSKRAWREKESVTICVAIFVHEKVKVTKKLVILCACGRQPICIAQSLESRQSYLSLCVHGPRIRLCCKSYSSLNVCGAVGGLYTDRGIHSTDHCPRSRWTVAVNTVTSPYLIGALALSNQTEETSASAIPSISDIAGSPAGRRFLDGIASRS